MTEIQTVHIGEAINNRRIELMLTKTELAQRIGVSRQRLNSILARPAIDTSLLSKVCEAMGYNFFTLYGRNEHEKIPFFRVSHIPMCSGDNFSEVDERNHQIECMRAEIKQKDEKINLYKELCEDLKKMLNKLQEKNMPVESLDKRS